MLDLTFNRGSIQKNKNTTSFSGVIERGKIEDNKLLK